MRATQTVSTKNLTFSELVKLKELKDQGIITDEEFESKKKEILKKY